MDEYYETSFRLPLYDVELTLRNGFWQLESYYYYWQLLSHEGDRYFLRDRISDIVRVLSQPECWHAKEYYTWNGGLDELEHCSLEEWLDYAKSTDDGIKEFSASVTEDDGILHDSLVECQTLFQAVQEKLNDYELLGIDRIGHKFYRARNEKGFYLIDINSYQPFNKEPYNDIIEGEDKLEFIALNHEGKFIIYPTGEVSRVL